MFRKLRKSTHTSQAQRWPPSIFWLSLFTVHPEFPCHKVSFKAHQTPSTLLLIEIGPKEDLSFMFPLSYQDSQPDLLVVVNYTTIGVPSNTPIDISRNSVQLMVGLTNNTDYVVGKTSPTTLIPGLNVVGALNIAVRRQFKSPMMSSFGMFDVSVYRIF